MENNIFIADKNKGAEKTLTGASARNTLEADDDEESGDEEEDLQRLWGESCGRFSFSFSMIFQFFICSAFGARAVDFPCVQTRHFCALPLMKKNGEKCVTCVTCDEFSLNPRCVLIIKVNQVDVFLIIV